MVITDQVQLDTLLKQMHLTPKALRFKRIFVAFTPRDFNGTNYYTPAVEGRDGEYVLTEEHQ